jgi:hypothetical protein
MQCDASGNDRSGVSRRADYRLFVAVRTSYTHGNKLSWYGFLFRPFLAAAIGAD